MKCSKEFSVLFAVVFLCLGVAAYAPAETMRLDSGHKGEVTIDESHVIGALFDVDEEVKHYGVGLINSRVSGYKPFNVYLSRDNKVYVHPEEASVGFGNGETRYYVRAKAGKRAFVYVSFYEGTRWGGFDFYKGNDVHIRVEEGEALIGRPTKEWPMPAIDFEGKGKVHSASFALMIDGLRVSVEQENISFGGTEFVLRPKEKSKYGMYQYRVTKQGTVIRERNPSVR